MPMKRQGLTKLNEECGELIVEIAKADAIGGIDAPHWQGPRRQPIEDEMADVFAALRFAIEKNGLDLERIMARAQRKYTLFQQWDLEPDDAGQPEGATAGDSAEEAA